MPSVFDENNQACSVNTEHNLVAAASQHGTFVVGFDWNNAAAADVFEIRIYKATRPSGTERLHRMWTVRGPQALLTPDSPPFVNVATFTVSIKQVAGTGRTIPWCIVQL